jgi:hypothetical protein
VQRELRDDDLIWQREYEAADDAAPRIPEGEYSAQTVRARTARLYNSERLVLTLEIVGCRYAGTRLDFIAEIRTGKHARFREAWEIANGTPAKRRDRMSLGVFRHRLFRVVVRDVTTDRFQRKRGRPYSIIATILEREA